MKERVICPRCGKPGFLTKRWVQSSYYPSTASLWVMIGRPDRVTGSKYWGLDAHGNLDGNAELNDETKKTAYHVRTRKYEHHYVGHYSPEKYKKEMGDFRAGKRKSRPNGRIWHSIHRGDWTKARGSQAIDEYWRTHPSKVVRVKS